VKKALLVARWEFLTTVTRRSYLFAVAAMPLLFLGLGALSAFQVPSAISSSVSSPTAIVDHTGLVDLDFATSKLKEREQLRSEAGNANPNPVPVLKAFSNHEDALAALTADQVAAVYVIEPDYLKTGTITAYGRNLGLFSQNSASQRQNTVADAIRASLLKGELEGDAFIRAFAPAASLKAMTVDRAGRVTDASNATGFGRFAGSFGFFLLFTMAIFFSAGFLQQATAEDRQNRMFEILVSSVDPQDLLLGKIIGLGGAGLLQVGLYILLIIVPGTSMLALFTVSLMKVLMALAYFVIGYLLFGCLLAAVGMISRTHQEGAQLSAIWTLTASAPMFFLPALSAAPNGVLARTLSFFPLTSPVTMMFRLTMTPDVPVVDVLISLAIGLAAVYLSFRGATKIFRAATLMYGKRMTLPELIRWLRA
jgi:ABC-2 type transport system permease protein